MSRLTLILACLVLVFCAWGAAAAEDNSVSVVGVGEVLVKPDVAYITFYVRAEGILMVDAAKEIDRKVAAVREALQESHDSIRSIDVVEVAVGQKSRESWGPDGGDDAPRPAIARRLRVAASPERDHVYGLIDTAIRAGALMSLPSRVSYGDDTGSIVAYGLVGSSGHEEEARLAAMEDAREKAEALAALAGKRIGELLTIQAGDSPGWAFPFRMMGQEVSFPTDYISTRPDEVRVRKVLSVEFELIAE